MPELLDAVCRLKPGKATGLSLVSTEMLQEVMRSVQGPEVLLRLVNHALLHPEGIPDTALLGQVLLFPKAKWITHAKQTRPIVWEICFTSSSAPLPV